jgi:elongation factor G
MKAYEPARIRNIGLFSHGGAGKTSLAEVLLFKAGAISRLGSVEEGTSTLDFDPDEVKRHMSVTLALAPLEWRDTKINLVDAPGYADFFGEVAAAMRAVDAALIVVDAVAGVQVGTDAVWKKANERDLPRLVFINKMERENASYSGALEALRTRFGKHVVPLVIPIGAESGFKGVVDLVSQRAYLDGSPADVPAEVAPQVEQYREMLVESVCEQDDALIAKYLEGETIAEEELRAGLRAAVVKNLLVPVLCGSALKQKGIEPLLDALVDYAPSAAEARSEVDASSGTLAALVFKTVSDPFIGRLSYVRVYSGTLTSDSHVWNANKSKDERLGQLFFMRGKHQEPTQKIGPGDIGVIPKLQETSTGDTLTTREAPVTLSGISFPAPAYSAAIHPKTKQDVDKLSVALTRILDEDPSLESHREESTGELILSGLGESHVAIAAERMQRKFGASVEVGVPQVPYRETVQGHAKAQGRYVRQTGGHGQYGVVWLEVEPSEPGTDFEFVDRIVGGVVPKQWIPSVEKGVREALKRGPLAGYPVVGVRVALVDGKYHPVDSSDQAFQMAGSIGFREAMAAARPTLLEPIYEVQISVPDEFTGDVMGDLNSRRARVLGMTPDAGTTTIEAEVPYAELLKYATELRSLTQGRGTYTMRFSRYEEAPPHIAQQVIDKRKKELEEMRAGA